MDQRLFKTLLKVFTLPETKSSFLKDGGWETIYFPLGKKAYFQGRTVSFRAGIIIDGDQCASEGRVDFLGAGEGCY